MTQEDEDTLLALAGSPYAQLSPHDKRWVRRQALTILLARHAREHQTILDDEARRVIRQRESRIW